MKMQVSNGTMIGSIDTFGKIVRTSKVRPQDMGMIVDITVNKTYSYKELAVVREYVCNARDAHAYKGNLDQPFTITAPTIIDPIFRVRDYGDGLTEERFEEIFINIASSDKRESDVTDGCYGIGAKSAFCYSNEFMVTVWNSGYKTMNLAHMSKKKELNWIQVSREKSDEPSGVEIEVSVKPESVEIFREQIVHICKYLQNCAMPKLINMKQDEIKKDKVFVKGNGWFINGSEFVRNSAGRYYGNNATFEITAIHGNVAYTVDLSKLGKDFDNVPRLGSIHFVFDLGEVDNPPSRETLEYTPKTILALKERCDLFKKEVLSESQKNMDASSNINEAVIYIPFFAKAVDFKYKGVTLNNITELDSSSFNRLYVKSTAGVFSSRNYSYGKTIYFSHDKTKKCCRVVVLDETNQIPSRLALLSRSDALVSDSIVCVSPEDKDMVEKLHLDLWAKHLVIYASNLPVPAKSASGSTGYVSDPSNYLTIQTVQEGSGYYNRENFKISSEKIYDLKDLVKGEKVYIPFHGHSADGVPMTPHIFKLYKKIKGEDAVLYGIRRKEIKCLGKEWIALNDYVQRERQKVIDKFTQEELEVYREKFDKGYNFEFIKEGDFEEVARLVKISRTVNEKCNSYVLNIAERLNLQVVDIFEKGQKSDIGGLIEKLYKKYPILKYFNYKLDNSAQSDILDYVKQTQKLGV